MSVAEFTSVLNKAITAKVNTTTFVFGTVSSINPIKVKLEGLDELPESLLIIGANCRERKAYFDKHTHTVLPLEAQEPTDGFAAHKHPILQHTTQSTENYIIINRGLKVGDNVLMLRGDNGQKYYIMERLGSDKL